MAPFGHAQLPLLRTVIRGRDHDIDRVAQLIKTDRGRLVTLTGAGGSGKTTLAIAVAQRLQATFRDGVGYVSLASLTDPALIIEEISRHLGIAVAAGTDPVTRLASVLGSRELLLIVDNVEQLVAGAERIATLADRCAALRLLVTSRRALRVPGERVYPVAGLDPDAAVTLFFDRAKAVNPGLNSSIPNVRAVQSICARLRRLPLAIELAAARTHVLTPTTLNSRLAEADGLQLLDGARTATDRHRSLTATIQWSQDLLTPPARRLLRRLSVFLSPFDLSTAEAVCAADDLTTDQILEALSELMDFHLIDPAREPTEPPTFTMPYPVRRFAAEQLSSCGEHVRFRQRHAEHHLAVMLDAADGLEGANEREWMERVDNGIAELRAALMWLRSAGRKQEALAGAAALGPYWLYRGLFADGHRLLEVSRDGTLGRAEAVALGWAIRLEIDGGSSAPDTARLDAAIADLKQITAMLSAEGSRREWLRANEHLSYALRVRGAVTQARTLCKDVLDTCDENELCWRAEFLHRAALLDIQAGDLPAAAANAAAVIDAAQRCGHARIRARGLQTYALVSGRFDDTAALTEVLTEVSTLSRQAGDIRGLATTLPLLGAAAADAGDHATSVRLFGEAIALGRDLGYWVPVALGMFGVALLAVEQGRLRDAARLHGVLTRHIDLLTEQLLPQHIADYRKAMAATETAMGADAFHQYVTRGVAMGDAEGIQHAMAVAAAMTTPRPAAPPTPPPRRLPQLTDREIEVLALIAQGHTNQEIAQHLGLSPKTVMHHSGHIYRKLGVRGRAEAAVYAASVGLVAAGREAQTSQ